MRQILSRLCCKKFGMILYPNMSCHRGTIFARNKIPSKVKAKAVSTHPICLTIWSFICAQYCPVYAVKSLERYLTRICRFTEGQYLDEIKFQIVIQVGCVDTAFFAKWLVDASFPFGIFTFKAVRAYREMLNF